MKYGEIITLGRHKLMCGDATRREDIQALIDGEKIDLILTDPPYGMKCQDKNGVIGDHKYFHEIVDEKRNPYHKKFAARQYPIIENDITSDTAKNFYENIKDYNATKIIWGGQYFADFLPVSGAWLFWHKLNGKNDFSDGELAWCSRGKRVRYYAHMWNGICRAGNYALNPKPRLHPTQKPVELHARILEDFSKPGNIILDCFGGSGTTLIACEITGRKCLMMEISPDYCDVIRDRYNKLTEGRINFAEAEGGNSA